MTSWFNWVTPRRGGRTASVEVDDPYDLVKGEGALLETDVQPFNVFGDVDFHDDIHESQTGNLHHVFSCLDIPECESSFCIGYGPEIVFADPDHSSRDRSVRSGLCNPAAD